MTKEMLTVLLGYIDDRLPIVGDSGPPNKILRVRKQVTPLRLQDIRNIEAFTSRFHISAIAGKEVHMGIAGVPAASVSIRPSLQTQFKFALTRLDLKFRPQWLIFKSTRHVDLDSTRWQPPLARTIDIRIRNLIQTHITANIYMPRVMPSIEMAMVAVRLIGNTFRRAEMNPTRDHLARSIVENARMNPVSALLHHPHV